VYARPCNGAETSLPWKLALTYLESCASIVQAVVSSCRPSCCCCLTKSVARRCSLKKSVQIHASSCVVGKYHKIPLSSPLSPFIHTNIYTTLLPLASAQAVLMGKTHSYNGRALGVPLHCAARCRISQRRLLVSCFCFLPLFLASAAQNTVALTKLKHFF